MNKCVLTDITKKMNNKIKRSANFTLKETEKLVELASKHKLVIEHKKTDAKACQKKRDEWKMLANEFNNSGFITYRDHHLLKMKYNNIKKLTKRKFMEKGKDSMVSTYEHEIMKIIDSTPSEVSDLIDDIKTEETDSSDVTMIPENNNEQSHKNPFVICTFSNVGQKQEGNNSSNNFYISKNFQPTHNKIEIINTLKPTILPKINPVKIKENDANNKNNPIAPKTKIADSTSENPIIIQETNKNGSNEVIDLQKRLLYAEHILKIKLMKEHHKMKVIEHQIKMEIKKKKLDSVMNLPKI